MCAWRKHKIIITRSLWVVQCEIITDKYIYEWENDEKAFMKYPFSCFDKRDELSKDRFPYADFATFPRGRLLYFVKEKRYYLYLDPCITQAQTDRLLSFFDLEKEQVRIAYDEHYRCDRCFKKVFKGKKI